MERKNYIFLLTDWLDILDAMPPKDYKAILSSVCAFSRTGELPGGLTTNQHVIASIIVREITLMDENYAKKRKATKRWREEKKKQEEEITVNHGESQEITVNHCEDNKKEKEKEKEKETHSYECGIGAATAAPPPAISEEKKKKLIADGIPAEYIEYFCDTCEAKGYHYDNPTSACKAWWKKDKSRPEWQQTSGQSFDTNEFFDAALRKSIGDNENT